MIAPFRLTAHFETLVYLTTLKTVVIRQKSAEADAGDSSPLRSLISFAVPKQPLACGYLTGAR